MDTEQTIPLQDLKLEIPSTMQIIGVSNSGAKPAIFVSNLNIAIKIRRLNFIFNFFNRKNGVAFVDVTSA